MRYSRLDTWSRQSSPLHRYHPVARILAAAAFLIAIGTLEPGSSGAGALYFFLLCGGVLFARLPLFQLLLRAAAALPFALCFAGVSALSGDPERAGMMLARSYLSALSALLLMATTPFPDLLAGLETLRMPRFLRLVLQFVYRYLVVLVGEATAMRNAAKSRGGGSRSILFRQAAGAAGVLFARAYARSQAIHQAMLARGFAGHIPVSAPRYFTSSDGAFLLLTAGLAIIIRVNYA